MHPASLKTFVLAGGLAALSSLACARPLVAAPVAPGPGGLEAWERHHPEASRELGAWVKAHPHAARKLFAWDAGHPERSREFVTWAITHPGEGVGLFAGTHRGWRTFDDLVLNHRPAANDFIAWCRRHPRAAEALMNHPGGLDWAGRHLYAGFWSLETSGH